MCNRFRMVTFALCCLAIGVVAFGAAAKAQDEIKLIVRGDDMGMTQGCNEAFELAFNNGVLTSGAIQVPAPWFETAAEMAKKNPGWCVGVHLCLIGEWQGYRWRPVLPYDKVSSLVDEDGNLYRHPDDLFAAEPSLSEVEAEFRAQIELALKRGVNVQYLDTHYLGYTSYPGIEDVFKKLGREYNLPISGMMDETRMRGVYNVPVDEKIDTAVNQILELTPGTWLWVCHIGIDSPEQNALIHTKPSDIFLGGGVGKHRAGELGVLTDINVRSALMKKGVKLISYTDLWKERGEKW